MADCETNGNLVPWIQEIRRSVTKGAAIIFYLISSLASKMSRRPFKLLGDLVRSSHAFEEENVQGKIAVITGANRGIGKEVAFELANRGATVVLACRNLEAAKGAIVDIRKKTSLGKLVPMHLDLSSLQSVRDFVKAFKEHFCRVDILINNAAIIIPDKLNMETADGFPVNYGTNFLGHFLLTNLLMELLRRSDFARVVHVSSLTMKYGTPDYQTPLVIKTIHELVYPQSYCNSKLALALFNIELAKRTCHLNVHTYCVCPGCVQTDISNAISAEWWGIFQRLKFLQVFLLLSTSQASKSILYCALGKESAGQSGELYRRCKLWGDSVYPDDLFVPGKLLNFSEDDAKILWDVCKKLTNIDADSLYI